jgi:hypothetical protein
MTVLKLLSVSEENFSKNLQLVDTIIEIAKKKKVTSSQLTLAWLLAQDDDIFPVRTPLLLSFSCSALGFRSPSRCWWSNKFDSSIDLRLDPEHNDSFSGDGELRCIGCQFNK